MSETPLYKINELEKRINVLIQRHHDVCKERDDLIKENQKATDKVAKLIETQDELQQQIKLLSVSNAVNSYVDNDLQKENISAILDQVIELLDKNIKLLK